MVEPLIEIHGLTRQYQAGEESFAALKDVDLTIYPGEMVAIIGQSGSGKSTLMNVIGCLDRDWTGTYRFKGEDVSALSPNEVARLRRENIGFIFQRYQLLPDLDAVENVEVPSVYAGVAAGVRHRRAEGLLTRLGLGDRLDHRPQELSGGQQQRVSVARALMNGGDVILADEPTGALDRKSGAELMALLAELHAEGHTIIIVTHDADVASRAERIIEISDGVITSDTRKRDLATAALRKEELTPLPGWREAIDVFVESASMALRSMNAHRLRTFLTMLGIIIGIASVVSVVALGQGSQERVLESISSIGTNTINVLPGSGFGDIRQARVRTLVPGDAVAIGQQSFADSVSPTVQANGTGIYRNVTANLRINGVSAEYFRVSGATILEGLGFSADDVRNQTQEAVIDTNARSTFFADGSDPVGQVLMVNHVPLRIVGVAQASAVGFGPADTINIWTPYTTAMGRITGQNYLSSISVRISDNYDMSQAEQQITALLQQRHNANDFHLQNTDTIRSTIETSAQTLTLLVAMIAVISLIVGGIGVMNIMLVSVTERTREIGVRMAVGARPGDIMRQFLIEAVLVCIVGGAAGVSLSLIGGEIATQFVSSLRLSYSAVSIIAAFVSSTVIGIAFGFMPARSAAHLDPVEALTRE
ncbi:MAG TPA: MacB family efflux pump subunit [Devosiaceae bacterium]|nr:MacB family efflux pump subunit [Devosiaceae bacterium]